MLDYPFFTRETDALPLVIFPNTAPIRKVNPLPPIQTDYFILVADDVIYRWLVEEFHFDIGYGQKQKLEQAFDGYSGSEWNLIYKGISVLATSITAGVNVRS